MITHVAMEANRVFVFHLWDISCFGKTFYLTMIMTKCYFLWCVYYNVYTLLIVTSSTLYYWYHLLNQGTSQALSVLYNYIYNGPPILMIFGPPYSSVSTLLNPAAGQYNMVQVSEVIEMIGESAGEIPNVGDMRR